MPVLTARFKLKYVSLNLVSAGAPARYVKWRLLACQHATTSPSDSFASTFWRLPKPTAASNATAAVASRHLFIRFYSQFIHLNLFYSYIRSSFFIYEIICSFLGILRRIFIVFKESEISAGVPVCSAFCSMCFVRLVGASRNLFIRIYSQFIHLNLFYSYIRSSFIFVKLFIRSRVF